jgi:diguanylate cyclase (GGDEF)-like protein
VLTGGAEATRARLVAAVLLLGAGVLLVSGQGLSGVDAMAYAISAVLMVTGAGLLLAGRLGSRVVISIALAAGLLLFLRRLIITPVEGPEALVQLEYTAFRGLVLLSGAAFIALGPRTGLALSCVGLVAGMVVVGSGSLGHVADVGAAVRLGLYAGVGIVMFRLLSLTLEDARASAETAAEAAGLAFLDELTGLPNRRQLSVHLRASVTRAMEGGTPDAVVMFDLDHFKVINDTHGHEIGDEVLVRTARIIQTAMREGDVLGRWGGEEFLALLEGTSAAEALTVADRCRRMLAADDAEPPVTASFGVATVQAGETMTDLLRRADLALYEAKQRGRNRVVLGESRDLPADRRLPG